MRSPAIQDFHQPSDWCKIALPFSMLMTLSTMPLITNMEVVKWKLSKSMNLIAILVDENTYSVNKVKEKQIFLS